MRRPALPSFSSFQLPLVDFLAALLIGEGIACMGLVISRALEIRLLQGISPAQERIVILIAFPLLAALGIGLAAVGSRWVPWLFQVAKFCLVGLFNTTIDFGILNLLIAYPGATQGILFSLSKAASSSAAVINSYAWNRLWTFAPATVIKPGPGRKVTRELGRFLAVTLVGVGLNVTVASSIVSLVNLSGGVAAVRWANLAAVVAVAVSATWDFLAYRYIVFRPHIAGGPLPKKFASSPSVSRRWERTTGTWGK